MMSLYSERHASNVTLKAKKTIDEDIDFDENLDITRSDLQSVIKKKTIKAKEKTLGQN